MDSRQIIALMEKYADNYQKFSEQNDALLTDVGVEKWQSLLVTRSKLQRMILTENEEILKKYRELMSEPINSKEEADEVLLYFRKVSNTRLSDYCLLEPLYKPLSEFYEKTGDYVRLLGLNVSASAIVLEYFEAMNTSMSPLNGKECSEKAIEYSKRVSPLSNISAWMSVFSAYANMIGSVKAYYPEIKKDFFKYYDEALAYYDDPVIGPAILEQPVGKMFKELIMGRILYAFDSYKEMNEKDKERFRRLINDTVNNPPEGYNQGELADLQNHTAYLIGEKKPREAYNDLLEAYYKLKKPDYNVGDIVIKTEDYLTRANMLEGLMDILRDKDFSADEVDENIHEIEPLVTELTHSVPYGYMTSYVNFTSASLCSVVMTFLSDKKELINVINSLLILRQPITYIHSLMVKEIAVLIASEMLKKRPELFIPLYGVNTKEVTEKADEIIAFISQAAMFHDIGKTKIADIVNNQYRRITDLEYGYIKLHPSFGPEVMNNLECFKPYFDIMLGHHKTYDGKGGYPSDFDNTKSPYRIIIDIITIADCTDAATDILGRNYARGKNFYDLLSELSQAKGTKYNPDIVSLIEESDELCEKLCYLTGDDRKRIYYLAYRDVMKST